MKDKPIRVPPPSRTSSSSRPGWKPIRNFSSAIRKYWNSSICPTPPGRRSLERQLGILRERNTELRNRLTTLLETSRRNDELFDHTRQLVLRLVAADSLENLCQALHEGLSRDFGLKYFRLLFLDRAIEYPAFGVGHADSGEAEQKLPALQGRNRTFCGVLRPDELNFLFGDTGRNLGSAAVVRLPGEPTPALLALAHPDPDHYHRDMDTLFLNHIADVLGRLLEQRL